MRQVCEVEAMTGKGLAGDRYCSGEHNKERTGSFLGYRPVTLINHRFVKGTPWEHHHRRNIAISGVELLYGFGRPEHAIMRVGAATLRIFKYCDPCERPGKLAGFSGMREALQDCGGVLAEVLDGGIIRIGDAVVPPPKSY